MVKKLTVVIALTSAVAIDGEIRVAGAEVEVDQDLAKDLLARGDDLLLPDGRKFHVMTYPQQDGTGMSILKLEVNA